MVLRPSFKLRDHSGCVRAVAELGTEDKILTVDGNRRVRIWSLSLMGASCGLRFWNYNALVDNIRDIAVVDETKVLIVSGRKVQVLQTCGRVMATSNAFPYSLTSCAVVNEKTAVVGDCEGNLYEIRWFKMDYLWSFDNMGLIYVTEQRKGHNMLISGVSSYREKFATCSYDGACKIWDITSMRPILTFFGHGERIESISVSDLYLITGTESGKIRLYDVRTANLLKTVSTHTNSVSLLRIIRGSNMVVSVGKDQIIAHHALPSAECVTRSNVGVEISTGVILSSGVIAVVGAHSNEANVFHAEKLEENARALGRNGRPIEVLLAQFSRFGMFTRSIVSGMLFCIFLWCGVKLLSVVGRLYNSMFEPDMFDRLLYLLFCVWVSVPVFI